MRQEKGRGKEERKGPALDPRIAAPAQDKKIARDGEKKPSWRKVGYVRLCGDGEKAKKVHMRGMLPPR